MAIEVGQVEAIYGYAVRSMRGERRDGAKPGRQRRLRSAPVPPLMAAIIALFAGAGSVRAGGPLPGAQGDAPSARVRDLLRRMTLEEKLALMHGVRDPEEGGEAGYWPGLPRLGIPPLRLADGSAGVDVNAEATALPAPVALAATFDPASAKAYGAVAGREARALGQDVFLAPHVNIVRDPLFRRDFSTFSEDPFLSAGLAVAEIRGIQSQGVMAQVKHLAAYNGSDNVYVDERTLHEIYLPAFEAAVRDGVASVMCAYNRVNGAPSCESTELLEGVLRGEWGFRGFVTSDWGAVHSPFAILKGLDLEMPGREISGRPGPYFTEPLRKAVEDGAVPLAAVDRALGRILGRMEQFHLLDGARRNKANSISVEADAAVARGIATAGAVLLRNKANGLPLSPEDLESVAIIGPTAGQVAAGFMGERGYGFEGRLVSPLTALQSIGNAAGHRGGQGGGPAPRGSRTGGVTYSAGVDLTGVPIPARALSHEGQPGLVRKRADGASEAEPQQIDGSLDFSGPGVLPPESDFSWSGTLTAPEDGDFTLMVQPVLDGRSEGGGSVAVDGSMAASTGGPGFGGTGKRAKPWSSLLPTTDGRDNGRGVIHLSAGPHRMEVILHSTGVGQLKVRLAWITPAMRRKGIEDAVAAARGAGTAVVFAWAPTGYTMTLPEAQDELIEKVAEVNRKTIVVLNTGGPVLMPWRDKVRAILEMWYPGQEGGWATADLLTGRASPGGKLPVTFPARLADAPARAAGHPERIDPPSAPGMSGTNPDPQPVTFSEGIFAGYRWYDQQGIEPLFPFGHGLSYSSFAYSDLAIARSGDGIEVQFTLRNTGGRDADETPQVYAGADAGAGVRMAPRSLVAFRRVRISAGHGARLKLRVPARQLSYWSVERHDWKLAEDRTIYVGSSSRDCPLSAKIGPR